MAATNGSETMQEAALKLARLGFAVFPIMKGTKQPRTDAALGFVHGLKDATRDPERIAAAWIKYPADNIGIACGAPSGNLIVIDIDNHNPVHSGFDALTAWEYDNGHMPETATATTGTGGMHLLYITNEVIHPCINVDLGIDIRGEGSYIVAPPSIHPNGKPYAWILPPDVIAVAQADERVMEFINHVKSQSGKKNVTSKGKHERKPSSRRTERFELPNIIWQGTRNLTLFKYGCQQRAQGIEESDIRLNLHVANETLCWPQPIPYAEVDRIGDSVMTYPPGYSAEINAAIRGEAV